MSVEELHKALLKAYTVESLNKISLTLLNLYKSEQFTILQKIAEIISDSVEIEIQSDGKGFSKLMLLYHPDRLNFHICEINKLAADKNFDALLGYSHILKLEQIEEIALSLDSYEDIDYSPVYEWDANLDDYSAEDSLADIDKQNSRTESYSFYDAIKIREYGHVNMEYPAYYLEDNDEFELSFSEICDLEGVQYCLHALKIDLSDNQIFDLNPLSGLVQLEELDLSNNELCYIDALSFLKALKVLNLAGNKIKDVSPLFKLESLEYVDLSGNPLQPSQINELLDLGIEVDF